MGGFHPKQGGAVLSRRVVPSLVGGGAILGKGGAILSRVPFLAGGTIVRVYASDWNAFLFTNYFVTSATEEKFIRRTIIQIYAYLNVF